VDPASVTPESVDARFAGQGLLAGRRLSPDWTRLTLFYDPPLPPSVRVRVTVSGDLLRDQEGRGVDADGDGASGGVAVIDFDTLSLARIPGTAVSAFVYDSYNKNPDGSDIPVVGATIRVDGFPEANAVTDDRGFFVLTDMPAPLFSVHIDGSTAVAPPGKVYATVGKLFHSVAGQSIQLIMDGLPFHIYLPTMDQGDVQPLSATQETSVVFGLAGTEELRRLFPDMDPEVWERTMVVFPPNSAVDEQGNPATEAAIIPVPSDRLPAPLPPNVKHQLDIAVMAPGATNFDQPAPACFPNLPSSETGEPLPPGAKSALISFNHDRGEWEMVGPMTVSADGMLVCTDPGVGIPAPGWHAQNPAASVAGGLLAAGTVSRKRKSQGPSIALQLIPIATRVNALPPRRRSPQETRYTPFPASSTTLPKTCAFLAGVWTSYGRASTVPRPAPILPRATAGTSPITSRSGSAGRTSCSPTATPAAMSTSCRRMVAGRWQSS